MAMATDIGEAKTQTAAPPAPKRKPRKAAGRWRITAYQFGVLLALIALWQVGLWTGVLRPYIYGTPLGVLQSFATQIANGTLIWHFWVTAQEVVLGFVIGCSLGSLAGLLLWLSPLWAKILHPYMIALNGVPKIALAPLIIVWFGLGMESKIAIAAIITFIVAFLQAYKGTQEVDQDLIRLMKSLGASQWQTFRKIVMPGSVPWIVSALRLNVGFALIGAVVGEYISAEAGLGYMVYYSGQLYDLNSVWVGIFSLMIMALILEAVVARIEKLLDMEV
ncbi:ABC transporter permease [Allosediminivita pacifica]|uniref:NitT/TauT family transport system permease protein n=1 Tax=Allosediminivita pacifica TaxID=1267769 RepID=A0A2T6AQP3_9RHOB|nr:ABC transporter permease [Allosediminivita pacifica]PTX46122.1 NitT/TauT family transport system permease protein [Allosediminivita pacifica]GGB18117.1 ABC transporter permease [Allosediminivita pacifica]